MFSVLCREAARQWRPVAAAIRTCTYSSQPTEKVECVVIGAGVAGIACARALALSGKEVLLIESGLRWGQETSARSSEVIHAGLYYPSGSLKARLCVQGKHMLYQYLAEKEVPHRRIGKLVVACSDTQLKQLESIKQQAAINGVMDLQWLSGPQAKQLEPQLGHVSAALLSPSTGILDSHTFMASMLADAESAGASLALGTRVVGGRVLPASGRLASGHRSREAAGFVLELQDVQSGEELLIETKLVVNAAGLWAQQVSKGIQGVPPASIPRQYLARGVYFTLNSAGTTPDQTGAGQETRDNAPLPDGTQPFPRSNRRPFTRLIYPIPQEGGLGVHLTLDLAGSCRFGPDVEWVSSIDYTVNPDRAADFYTAIRTYWPALPDGALQPGYAGVRPKINGPGQPAADFMIQAESGPAGHQVPGLVCLYGIESPGITASLALAQHVKSLALTGRPPDPL